MEGEENVLLGWRGDHYSRRKQETGNSVIVSSH